MQQLTSRRWQAGVTLIELMVALAIAGFLMVGAIDVFLRGRDAFRLTESISRLQENGRFALAAIEPDIRMANYWGLTSRSVKIQGRKGSESPIEDTAGACGADWLIDIDRGVDGSDESYPWGVGACAAGPAGAAAVATADTLVVRRVGAEPIAEADLQADTLYVQTSRFQDGQIFIGTAVPAGYTEATSETHQLVVNGYYVSQRSVLGSDMPSLRRKTLVGGGAIADEEVLPGVEDMQVQFGVDTDVVGAANRGSIDRYVNPGDPIITPGAPGYLPNAEILAVRIWLRVRAERPETAFQDAATYVYADQNIPAPGDHFRRVVVTKTIYLRNARQAT
jgi:type IV pilus assembly protein PilW